MMHPVRPSPPWLPTLSLLVAVGSAAPAAAQVYTGLDATLASRYVWRGVTRVNHWVLQPEAYVGFGVAGGFLSAGAWANAELHAARVGDLSDLGPGGSGWGEVSYWANFNGRRGVADISLAFLRYTYRGTGAGFSRTSAANTSEIHASLRFSSRFLAPKFSGYFDIDEVVGTYLEMSGTIPVLGNPLGAPFWALYVEGVIGYSLGQEVNSSQPGEAANFADDGFTHFDLSLSGNLTPKVFGAPTTVHLEGHVQFNSDRFTRRASTITAGTNSATAWATVSLRWEHVWWR